MHLLTIATAFLSCLGVAAGQDGSPTALLWDSCYWVEGKGGTCGLRRDPKPFKYFLRPGNWEEAIRFEISGDSAAGWHSLGRIGGVQVRDLTCSYHGTKEADVVVAEQRPGRFVPLMAWSGEMPAPEIVSSGKNQVLVISKDFGGNVPMVSTWAWIMTPSGLLGVDIEKAQMEAIEKVVPNHTGYNTGFDWKPLSIHTWIWPVGHYPGKIGVNKELKARFTLREGNLSVTRVELQDREGIVRWP